MRCHNDLGEGTLVQYTPVRVYCRAFVKKIRRSFLGVQDDNMGSKKFQMEDIRP